ELLGHPSGIGTRRRVSGSQAQLNRAEENALAPVGIAERSLAEDLSAGRELRTARRFDEADALLSEALAHFPNEPHAHIEWGLVPTPRRGGPSAARRWAEMRRALPANPVAYAFGAVALRELDRDDEAETLLADAGGRFPDDFGVANESAWLPTVRRDWPEALRRWKRVRSQFPDRPGGYTGVAMCLRELQRFEEAEAVLTEAIERFPDEPGPHLDYARIADARRDWAKAVERWERVRERCPDQSAG